MKIGVRKPSISKSLKARTTSKLKRQVKRAIIPTYGQKDIQEAIEQMTDSEENR